MTLHRSAYLGLLFVAPAGSTLAQSTTAAACSPQWAATFDKSTPLNGQILRVLEHDDGSGPALFVGGDFTSAGAKQLGGLGKWNGSEWSPVGAVPVNLRVWEMYPYDDGSGPALYVGGLFGNAGGATSSNIARWNGSSWSSLGAGTNGFVRGMDAFDDGTGQALYVSGEFTEAGGAPASRVAKWDGANWSPVGAGMNGTVIELRTFDDGSGPLLYAAGTFTTAGGVPARNIAKWDGSTWTDVGGSADNGSGVVELQVLDDGSGPALYVGGRFDGMGGLSALNMARWRGGAWSLLGAGSPSEVTALTSFDDGSGSRIYVAASPIGGSGRVLSWNGSSWAQVSDVFAGDVGHVHDLAGFDSGNGPELYAGGGFTSMGVMNANHIAKWSPSGWLPVDEGRAQAVAALEVVDLGAGPRLIVASAADVVDSVVMRGIGAWDGATWSAFDDGFNQGVHAVAEYDDGTGPALYAAGSFTTANGAPVNRIAKWTGSTWVGLGSGLNGQANVLAVYDRGMGAELYVGGNFTTAGGVTAPRVARWNGSVWRAVGFGTSLPVRALRVFDDGSGPALYVGGDFTVAGPLSASRIARWNSAGWSAVGAGVDGPIHSLEVFDDGSGPRLFAGGAFTQAGGAPAAGIARWDGAAWSSLGAGCNGTVSALRVFDDGAGEELYVGGDFSTAGGVSTGAIARWNGANWSALGAGFLNGNAVITALSPFQEATGPALYIGGSFSDSPGGDAYLAVWRGCGAQPTIFCTPQAPGTTNGCIATIAASGQPNVAHTSPCTLTVSNVEGDKAGLLFYSVSGQVSTTWCASSPSLLCVAAPTQRMGTQNSGGAAGSCDGVLVEDWNAYQLTHPTALGNPWMAGAVVDIQAWFRDPPACKTTSLSEGLRLTYQ